MDIVFEWGIGIAIFALSVALARVLRRSGKSGANGISPSDEAVQLRQSIDSLQSRVAGLEERLDFTERLLAKVREVTPPNQRLEPSRRKD